MRGHVFVVRRKLIAEMLRNAEWARRLREAVGFADVARIVKDYCLERGYGVHHDIVSGRLVVCNA